ncbi:hypothetical protein Clacol_008700 [Clathrus columnatus]|uniref:chitinase n=1 Tax=Clathrus columnatus TaxID=1419009 RepID=A0AAV5APY1_9AGAM|nr:hypothetical protein Clacol_008700 [Clathrus columnatus]
MPQSLLFSFVIAALRGVLAFDATKNSNLAVYWGQNSYGVTHPSGQQQQNLTFYCQDDSIDVLPLAFLDTFFAEGGLPHYDLSNICSSNSDPTFPNSELAECQFLTADIEACQAKGKLVTLSLGGGAASGVTFSSASQAQSFADQIWNLFLGGTSSTRPFGSAVLDGVDLDIEGGGTTYYDSFIAQIQTHAAGASKKYYISGAPQCPYPDAYMGTVLNAASFDMVYVQFLMLMDNWAKTVSINPNVKVYIGAPASSSAAGSGYVDAATLGSIVQQTQAQFSSFGGVMMWDASQAYVNNRYDAAIKGYLTGGTSTPPSTSTPPPPSSSPPPKSTSTSTSHSSSSSSSSKKPTSTSTVPSPTSTAVPTSCSGVPAWSSTVAYQGGSSVVYNGDLWTAKWWSEADTPGGAANDWINDGSCASLNAAVVNKVTAIAAAAAPTTAVTTKSSRFFRSS